MQHLPLTILLAAWLWIGDDPVDGPVEEPAPVDLSVRYEPGLGLGMQAHFEYTDEITARVQIDGQREVRVLASVGLTQTMSRSLEVTDRYRTVAAGRPSEVLRDFERLDVELERPSHPGELIAVESSQLEGVTLVLKQGPGGVEAHRSKSEHSELLEGLELQGFAMHLGLDALLPDGEVVPGESWELDADALGEALQLNVGALLFPPELKAESAENARRVGRGIGHTLKSATWELEARLGEQPVEVDGEQCLVIELAGSAHFDQPRLDAASRQRASRWRHVELELEGQAFLALETRLPVRLEVGIEVVGQESLATRGRNGPASIRTAYKGRAEFEATYEQLEAKD